MREDKTENGENVSLDRLLEDIKVVVHDTQELLSAGLGTVRQQARLKAQTTGRFVREKPYHTMGLVFGLGLLAGVLAAGMLTSGPEEEEGED